MINVVLKNVLHIGFTKKRVFAHFSVFILSLIIIIFSTITPKGFIPVQQSKADNPWPSSPPAAICSNTSELDGPSTAPSGAVTVPSGDNSSVNFNQANTTFWFAPGTHTLASGAYSNIVPGNNSTYIGAPGAILDGQNDNQYAFTGTATGVTVEYLTIQNFGTTGGNNNEGVVNHDAGHSWTITHNTVKDNAGAGVFVGTGDSITYNCLTANQQYGFSAYETSGVSNITLDHNEISYNDTYDWESHSPGCGCTGGGKFWATTNATITNNYVHNNHSVGIWADTNNVGFDVENNYISDNASVGFEYEISYNALIKDNNFINNGWVSGPNNPGFPTSAIYLSESGGDSRVSNSFGYSTINISDNNFADNWGGVILWENANRFCGSPANTSSGDCTLPAPTVATIATCDQTNLEGSTSSGSPDYYDLCRWKTQNVTVSNNSFNFNPSNIGSSCTTANECGYNGIFSEYGSYPTWSPYQATSVENAVTYDQNNVFSDNTYDGPWNFMPHEQGTSVSFATWQASPYNQDAGSTLSGGTTPTPTGSVTPTVTPTVTPMVTPTPTTPPSGNLIDVDTATLEGSIGHWESWFSDTVSQSSDSAHTGSNSLLINVTDPFGWGVQLNNYPGFTAAPGDKTLSFWAKLGSGTDVHPTMTVQWLDADHALLQTDTVTMPTLTTSWQNATSHVTAPAGTSSFLVLFTGADGPGDSLYIDDAVVENYLSTLDNDTSTLEGSLGHWENWYSATVAQSTESAHTGTHSLGVTVTNEDGWGVQLDNWPGFDVTAGTKRISYWAKLGAGSIEKVALKAQWFDADNNLLQTDSVPVDLTTSWKEGTADVIAPSGASHVYVTVVSDTGNPGDTAFIDDVHISNILNYLDADTASVENSLGQWNDWYSETVSSSSESAQTGSKSMKVTVTDPWGWGVQFNDWPGIAATPGDKVLTFNAKKGTGSISSVTVTAQWFDTDANLLQTDNVSIDSLSSEWKRGSSPLTAPAGTAYVRLEPNSDDGTSGDSVYLDGFVISDLNN